MVGNNLLVMNQASIIQMVEKFLNDTVISALHPKMKVTSVTEPYGGTFHVRFEERLKK